MHQAIIAHITTPEALEALRIFSMQIISYLVCGGAVLVVVNHVVKDLLKRRK